MLKPKIASNSEIARILSEMGMLYELQGVPFKPQAYEKAALAVEAAEEQLSETYRAGGTEGLKSIPGIGAGIALRIEELLLRGKISDYQKLKEEFPVDIRELTAVEGVGPKSVKVLYEKLGVRTVADLERAARAGKIRRLERFGGKSEEKILRGIEFLFRHRQEFVLGFYLPTVRRIEAALNSLREVERAAAAGSVRRRRETIGDIDILVVSKTPETIMDFVVSLPEVETVRAKGGTKTLVRLRDGLDLDVRVVPRESFGAALQYFTGSKSHNVALRKIAALKGYKLNEYGLFRGKKMIAGETEEEIYKILGLAYIEPELRENRGEIEAAREGRLPELIEYGELKGDLQVQTDWTDGAASIQDMAMEAKKAGLQYIAITDHTKSLAMTGGADEAKLERQGKEIDKINKEISDFRILKGAEVNILADGSLDINNEALAKLDIVGAAVHSHFKMPKEEATKRLVRVMENPHVDILMHPTARVIGRREAIDVDMNEIIRTARRTGTVLEIDAYPDRLDLKDEHIRLATKAGVKLSISSDSHHPGHYQYLELGVAQARRGWAEKKDVVNAWPMEKMLGMLKK